MSDDNVVDFPGLFYGEIEPSKVLNAALAADLDYVIIVGKTKDGADYTASSIAYFPDVYWRLVAAAQDVLAAGLEEEKKDGQ